MRTPLAERMRPRSLDEVIGQDEVLAPLKEQLEAGAIPSLILWGPPGSGKTTIALAIASEADAHFESISAVTSGIKDLREVIARAAGRRQQGEATLLFIDEIHRWNKSQQDALLPHVESGAISLVGATTEHPGFEINRALMSRLRLAVLRRLSDDEVEQLIDAALENSERGLAGRFKIDPEALEMLVLHADGDARVALVGLEAAASIASERIDAATLERALGTRKLSYGKGSEEHYAIASALIKSIRGSNPDAALYWLARMEAGGEDPRFVARRLVIAASEEIGMARPGALAVTNSGFDAVERVGAPECWINLAHVAAYLAECPKSWASYHGWRRAQQLVTKRPAYSVPSQLRNASTKIDRQRGHGEGYVHASKPGASEEFLPAELAGERIYRSA